LADALREEYGVLHETKHVKIFPQKREKVTETPENFKQSNEEELKTAAGRYHDLGLSVIPFKLTKKGEEYDKIILTSGWKKWETQLQTDEEFEALNWNEANAFAVVLGTPARNGRYLSVVDYDCKGNDVTAEVKEKGRMLLKEFPITCMEQTVNNGLHLIFWSRTKPKTIGSYHNTVSLELLGEKKLCLMAPSLGYSKLNDNSPTEIEDIEQTFLSVMKKHGLLIEQTQTQQPENRKQTYNKPRPCILQALKLQLTGPNGHLMRLAIAAEYKRLGYTDQEIIDLFKNQADFDVNTCSVQVASIDAEKTAKCETIKEYGYCLPHCSLKSQVQAEASTQKTCKERADDEEKDVYVQRPTLITPDFIAEEIWNRRKEPPQYLVYRFKEGTFETQKEIPSGETNTKGQNIIYIPVFNDSIRKGLVIVPSGYSETTFKELFEEIDKFALLSYDPCGQDALVRLLTRICVGSWFLDRFVADPAFDIAGSGKFAPIIPIRGPSQSGKNRLAFVLRLLSYRPYFEMSTYRIPSLYRPMDLWQGTLVLDEADFANTNEKSELVHFLNCRATGTPLSRQNPKNPKITDTFSNFGLTIVTQRRPFDDNATESRALPFYSEASDKKLPVIETDEMLKQGLELQNKLLYLRMKYYQQVSINKEAWVNELNDHRLVASLLPLIALSKHEPSLKDTITKTAKEVEKAKIEEKANSMDGLIINVLWEKISEGLFDKWRPNIFYVLNKLDIETVDERETEHKTALTTKDLADQFKWSPQSIRKAIGSLGIAEKGLPTQVKVDGKNSRVIFFDPRRIEKRLREFVVNYTPGKVTEVTRVTDLGCDIPDSPLFACEKQDTLHRKSVTAVTNVTSPEPYLSDFDEKRELQNKEVP